MCKYCKEDATTKKAYDGTVYFLELPAQREFNGSIYYKRSFIYKTNSMYFLRTHYAITKINYCPMCRKKGK